MLGHVRHWGKIVLDSDYRETNRLLNMPRRKAGVTSLLGRQLEFVDGRSCALQYQVIFKNGIYAMKSSIENPRILDAGANIGVASLYFKSAFPKARICAFEADPEIADVLQRNLRAFCHNDVEVHCAGVSNLKSEMKFITDGSDGGRLVTMSDDSAAGLSVPVVRLRDWLIEPVDLLKLDIEGAEFDVVVDCEDRLDNVSNIFVEYHSFSSTRQQLPELLAILRNSGFRLYVQTDFCAQSPLYEVSQSSGMDLRLNIFATKPREPSSGDL
jgi:FkbM family methyltransferase